MTHSPKELIKNNTSLTPEEVAQLGIRWAQLRADVFQIRGPDIGQRIENVIAHLRQRAELYIEEKPATDGTFDCTAAAKAFLYKLQVIECLLAAAERNGAERNGASPDLRQAVYYSLLLAINDHQLTVIGNETAIAARQASIKGARTGGRLRSANVRIRNREMALKFLARRGGNLKDTALMAKIGAAKNLKRRASVNAIESGLKDLNRD